MTSLPPPIPPPIPNTPRRYTPPIGNTDLPVGETFSEAWRVFTGNYGMLLGASLLTMVIAMAANFVVSIFGLLVTLPIMSGLSFLAVRLARGPKPEFSNLFDGFKRYPEVLLAGLLKILIGAIPLLLFLPGIILLIVSIVALVQGWKNPPLAVAGIVVSSAILLIGLGLTIWLQLRLCLVDALVLDPQAGLPGSLDALKASWSLTRPVVWPLLGLQIIMLGISLLCAVLLILPVYFVAMPLMFALQGVIYKRIVGTLDPLICRQCAYDLRGTTGGLCPECGTPRPG